MDEFKQIIGECKDIFLSKMKSYGPAWRILRLPSLTDQLLIKVYRIRNLETLDQQKVPDTPEEDLMGVVNYALMALVQLRIGVAVHAEKDHMSEQELLSAYNKEADEVYRLFLDKNHDYGDIWRQMRPASYTDQLLMKVLRLQQIEDRKNQSQAHESVDSIYQDIVNYAIFSLICTKNSL